MSPAPPAHRGPASHIEIRRRIRAARCPSLPTRRTTAPPVAGRPIGMHSTRRPTVIQRFCRVPTNRRPSSFPSAARSTSAVVLVRSGHKQVVLVPEDVGTRLHPAARPDRLAGERFDAGQFLHLLIEEAGRSDRTDRADRMLVLGEHVAGRAPRARDRIGRCLRHAGTGQGTRQVVSPQHHILRTGRVAQRIEASTSVPTLTITRCPSAAAEPAGALTLGRVIWLASPTGTCNCGLPVRVPQDDGVLLAVVDQRRIRGKRTVDVGQVDGKHALDNWERSPRFFRRPHFAIGPGDGGGERLLHGSSASAAAATSLPV